MFIKKKDFVQLTRIVFDLQNTVFELQDTAVKLTNRLNKLEKQIKQVDEKASKRFISDKTTEAETVPFSQIMDEWMNGDEEDDSGK